MNWKRRFFTVASLLAVSFAFVVGGHAAGSKSKEEKQDEANQLYEQGVKLAEAGDFEAALDRFERAKKERKKDPDVLNMIGFTQRKLGRLDAAFASYAEALKLRPDFPEAREYLGEAHLQAALEQLRILSAQGASEEVAQLRDAIAQAAWRAGAGTAPAGGDSTRRW